MSNEVKPTNNNSIIIVVVGLTLLLQLYQSLSGFIGHQTGTDTKRQIEPTQTADISQIQSSLSAIRVSVEETNKKMTAFQQWQTEELRAISDLRARVQILEKKTYK